MNYNEALAKLHSLERAAISPGLERIAELCRRLGHPERQLKHVIHITGTNGKGSVAAMLSSVLVAAGKKTALFTSPHLSTHTERYRINNQAISEQRFAELFCRVYAEHCDMQKSGFAAPTEFETVTALALLWFAEEQVDHAVIEVGLGGLTDSTNIVSGDMAIITNIGLDHSDFLGESIEQVAWHKSGIIKKQAIVITAAEQTALAIIRDKCEKEQAKLYVLGEDFIYYPLQISQSGSTCDIATARAQYSTLQVPLLGGHQLKNAALAVQAAELLGIDEAAIRKGIGAVTWPARLEIASEKPLILLDGAHNYAGMLALAESLDTLFSGKKIICVLGMLNDKEREKCLDLLLPRLKSCIITRPPFLSRSEKWQDLAAICTDANCPAETIEDNAAAIEQALQKAAGDEMILVCGSLYMVAAVRQYLLSKQTGQE